MEDLLTAHGLLMAGLAEPAGHFRCGGVGVFRDDQLIHMAPPAARVPILVGDLLGWLSSTDEHPLVSSCLVHYELEFIHPFTDGNGRLGRLWQSLILTRWQPLLAYLPVETVIRDRQQDYYAALRTSDHEANAAAFVTFLLLALTTALQQALASA